MEKESQDVFSTIIHYLRDEALSASADYGSLYQEYKRATENLSKKDESKIFKQNFRERQRRLHVRFAVLQSGFLEGAINTYFAFKCKSEEEFQKIECENIVKKWTSKPRRFLPKYCVPKDSNEYKELDALVNFRNACVHHKIRLQRKDGEIFNGNLPEGLEMYRLMGAWSTLPDRLIDKLSAEDYSTEFQRFRCVVEE